MKMKMSKTNNKCRSVRTWVYSWISGRVNLNAQWVQNHIANCPKCRQRLASLGRVNLALSAIKSQAHSLDLLMRANTQAVRVLKHSLRNAPKAQKLKTAQPEPTLPERLAKYKHAVASAAACIAILLLMKTGIFSSVNRFQSKGQQVIRQYYVANAGEDLADEVFSA